MLTNTDKYLLVMLSNLDQMAAGIENALRGPIFSEDRPVVEDMANITRGMMRAVESSLAERL